MAKKKVVKKPVKKASKPAGKKDPAKVLAKAASKGFAKKPVPKAKSLPKKIAAKVKQKVVAVAEAVVKPAKPAKVNVKDIFGTSPVIQREGGQIRVLIGKAGLDGHDRGAKVIARACRDAGFEVVYTGLHQTPEMIVNTAIQEDVDVVGLSILSGAHNYLVPAVVQGLNSQGVKVGKDILILVGGIIPDSDFKTLRDAGVSMVFTPGTSIESIVTYIREHVVPKS
jgi:methylmalonyl-CoA mutase C-terminal domain/subunit